MGHINTQTAAQYNINAFQRVEIEIGNIDRTLGEYFGQYEGTSFYVERCDFPVMLNLESQYGGVGRSLVLRDGVQLFDTAFKGFTLVHPKLSVSTTAGFKLTLLVLKDNSGYTNQLNNPLARSNVSWRNVGFGSTGGSTSIYVPPGVRSIGNLQYNVTGTISIGPSLTFYDATGNQINGPQLSVNYAGASVTYDDGGSQTVVYPTQSPVVVGGPATFNFPLIAIPTGCAELHIVVTGSAMSVPSLYGSWE